MQGCCIQVHQFEQTTVECTFRHEQVQLILFYKASVSVVLIDGHNEKKQVTEVKKKESSFRLHIKLNSLKSYQPF